MSFTLLLAIVVFIISGILLYRSIISIKSSRDKKAQIETLRNQQIRLKEKIARLETEVSKKENSEQ